MCAAIAGVGAAAAARRLGAAAAHAARTPVRGPLQDTVIQRWRDPADGTVCYIYLPITAPHSPPTGSGYVQYGANTIGSISCVAPVRAPAAAAPAANK